MHKDVIKYISTPSHSQDADNQDNLKKRRASGLELYRIIVMLMIVAHHYVVNSGLMAVLNESLGTAASNMMLLFGAWGKTGINCFVLITGYFMCKSKISRKKLLKLYLQITFYTLLIYSIFCFTGHESFHSLKAVWKLFPVKSISSNFVGCFLLFYLFIPFLNIFLEHIDKKIHSYLVVLLLLVFSILPSIPSIDISFNYVSWFIALYMIASYMRFYGDDFNITHRQWGYAAIMSILLGCVSIVAMIYLRNKGIIHSFHVYFFVSDSNKILSLLIALTTFMWFKGLNIGYIPLVNILGASTFGVLLIHANSNAMRQWLWKETIDCVGHYNGEILYTLGYAIISVVIIFTICAAIEWIRATFIEPYIMHFSEKFINRIRKPQNTFLVKQ